MHEGGVLRRLIRAMARWLGPHASMWILLAVGAGLVLGFSWAGGEVYEAVVEQDSLAALDRPVLDWAVATRTPALDTAVTAFTNVGGGVIAPVVAAVATAVLTIWMRHWRPLVLIPAAAAGSLLVTLFGKQVTGRARPPLTLAVPPYEHSPSFPSGHTLNATVLAGIIAYLVCLKVQRTWARVVAIGVAAVYALAIGFSRVFLGHHWLTDVVAAWFLGLAWLTMVIVAHRVFRLVRLSRGAHSSVASAVAPPAGSAHDGADGPPPSSSSRGGPPAG